MVKIATNKVNNANVVLIEMEGRFDFSVHKEFRASYKECKAPDTQYEVNMKAVDYIDSSALGMLLLLREHAQKYNGKVDIINCSANIMKILKIANFDRLFDIS